MSVKLVFFFFPFLHVLLASPISPLKPSAFPKAILDWKPCSTELEFPSRFECAELQVPLDWSNTSGENITLFMNKAPATKPEKRIGSVVFNPGGPGGSGSRGVATLMMEYGTKVNEYFDLIGPDPRGVAHSTAVRCSPELWNKRVSMQPKTEEEFNDMVSYWNRVGKDCLNRTGPLLNHVDTISVVHDFEAIRIALDEGPLNFWGFSYGTQLGSQYAEIYPKNIRAMALDAITDHSSNYTNFAVAELTSFETVLQSWLDWVAKNETSPFHGEDTTSLFDKLVASADKNPIPAPGCSQSTNAIKPCRSDVTGEEIKMTLFNVLSPPAETVWPLAAEALAQAQNGNATLFATNMPRWYNKPTSLDFSEKGIGCQDWTASSDWAQFQNQENLLKSVSPRLQGVTWTMMLQAACLGWPTPLVNLPKTLEVKNVSTQILLINALYDPQTPYEFAVNLQRMIEGSVLLTRRGFGHGSAEQNGETQRAVEAYLINGTVPEAGIVYDT